MWGLLKTSVTVPNCRHKRWQRNLILWQFKFHDSTDCKDNLSQRGTWNVQHCDKITWALCPKTLNYDWFPSIFCGTKSIYFSKCEFSILPQAKINRSSIIITSRLSSLITTQRCISPRSYVGQPCLKYRSEGCIQWPFLYSVSQKTVEWFL